MAGLGDPLGTPCVADGKEEFTDGGNDDEY
jgi:hypothetical protein